jgi:YD repeat-containing protein
MANSTTGSSTINYLYNGLGQRVYKSGPTTLVPTGVNRYVYDEAGHLLGEYDVNGNALQETVYLGDTPVSVLLSN